MIVTLILVHFFGRSANGAARWLDLGFFDLQPSETAKILLILFYAQFIMKYREQFNTMRVLLLAVLFIIPPLILIYKQPNLSTTILVSVLFCVLMFVGGLSWKIIGGVLAVAVPSVLIFLSIVMQEGQTLIKDYQRNRIMELGFIGSAVVILLLILIAMRCVSIARVAKDTAGMVIAAGIGALIGIQGFMNIAVATMMMPNTGLPLPFVSYGLSSLVSMYIGIGFVLNVGLQRKNLYNF